MLSLSMPPSICLFGRFVILALRARCQYALEDGDKWKSFSHFVVHDSQMLLFRKYENYSVSSRNIIIKCDDRDVHVRRTRSEQSQWLCAAAVRRRCQLRNPLYIIWRSFSDFIDGDIFYHRCISKIPLGVSSPSARRRPRRALSKEQTRWQMKIAQHEIDSHLNSFLLNGIFLRLDFEL